MRRFDGEPGAAVCVTVFSTITQVGSDFVRAGLQAGSVNLRGGAAPGNLHTGAIPVVSDRTLGIEIGSRGRRGHSLASEDFDWLDRASRCGWNWRRSTTEHKNEASLCSQASDISSRHSRRSVPVTRHNIIGPDQTKSNVPGNVDIKAAAKHKTQFVDIMKGIRHKAMIAD